ncbi:MAG: GDP-mannose 4,6-dehydratase [Myxococcales bacterium]
MERILVTGCSGFVSRHFLEYLAAEGVDCKVLGVSRGIPEFPHERLGSLRFRFRQLDLLDRPGVAEVIASFRPTAIVHLASYSSVGFSWVKPVESFTNNTNVLLNLVEEVRRLEQPCRILSVGSSEEYGNVDPAWLPLREEGPLNPVSPYAVARVAQEMLSKVYVSGYGLDIVMTRSFNHIGPYQRDSFVIPSFAKQLCAIRYGNAAPRLVTGDRAVVRDFVDVRDVVRGYHMLLQRGRAGEIYNLCTGHGTSIDEVITTMQGLLGTDAELVTDPALVRPSDNRVIVGSLEKMRRELGWEPKFSLHESLGAILDWWGGRTKASDVIPR